MTIEVMFVSKSMVMFGSDIQETLFNGKTYPGMRKIFPICQKLSSGMMVNGNAYFENVPIETLIGEFKNQTDFNKISDIKSIKEDFISFLAKNTQFTTTDEFVSDVLETFKDDLIEDIEDYGFHDAITKKRRKKAPPFLKKYSKFDSEFDDIIPANVNKQKYTNILWEIFSYELQYEGTGIILAGYDEKNHYSSHFELNILFNDNGKLIYEEIDSDENVDKAKIKVYAIKEEAYTFITGVHEDFIDFIINYIYIKNEEFIEDLIWSLDGLNIKNLDTIRYIAKKLINKTYVDIEKDITAYRLNVVEFTSDSLEYLPTWLISIFVDLLIYLTAVKQKTTSQQESVSMATDIAIMTKNDGFKFIKDDSHII